MRAVSLRRYLLSGILIPVCLLVTINTFSLYNQALSAVNTAYDRTLLASAKSIGEQLDVKGYDEQSELRVTVPYAALEAFEADNQSRMYYRVSTLGGEMISGFAQLPFWNGRIYTPPVATADDLLALQKALGMDRVVIVTPRSRPSKRSPSKARYGGLGVNSGCAL